MFDLGCFNIGNENEQAFSYSSCHHWGTESLVGYPPVTGCLVTEVFFFFSLKQAVRFFPSRRALISACKVCSTLLCHASFP